MTGVFNSNLFLPKLNKMGVPLTADSPRSFEDGSRSVDIISPNLCDQTSWYQQSSAVTGQAMTDITEQGAPALTYQLNNHANFVILNPRKVSMEEGRILMANGSLNSMSDFFYTVMDDAVDVTDEIDSVDFPNAKITFKSSFSPSGTLTFSGHVVDKSSSVVYIVKPPTNVEIYVVAAEMQFSTDVDISLRDQVIRVEILSGLGQVPFENIPLDLGERDFTYYNTFAFNPYSTEFFGNHFGRRKDYYDWSDFESVSNVGKNVIPPWGNKAVSTIEFPFNYLEGFPLSDATQTGMRLYVLNTGNSSGPVEGTYATITLYTKWRELT